MIRPASPADQAYIASTWTRSVLSATPGARPGHTSRRHMRQTEWDRVSKEVDAVMDRPDSRAIVTCHPIQRDRIVGWLAYVAGAPVPIIHYVYVRHEDPAGGEQRGRGFAGAMLAHIGVTHSTAVVCTSLGPSSAMMRGRYKAAEHLPLDQFLGANKK